MRVILADERSILESCTTMLTALNDRYTKLTPQQQQICRAPSHEWSLDDGRGDMQGDGRDLSELYSYVPFDVVQWLRILPWPCPKCHRSGYRKDYKQLWDCPYYISKPVRFAPYHPAWREAYMQHIVLPGARRVCNHCSFMQQVFVGATIERPRYDRGCENRYHDTSQGYEQGTVVELVASRWLGGFQGYSFPHLKVSFESFEGFVVAPYKMLIGWQNCSSLLECSLLDAPYVKCQACGEERSSQFTKLLVRHWYNDPKGRPLVCQDCANPPCTRPGCDTCRTCRDVTCRRAGDCKFTWLRPGPGVRYPRTKDELSAWSCKDCKTKCSVCEETKKEADFSESMLHNRKGQRMVCRECTNPPCSRAELGCTTCRSCRSSECTTFMCSKAPEPRLPYPSCKAELATWLCENCSYFCDVCSQYRSKANFNETQLQHWTRAEVHRCMWCMTCRDCGRSLDGNAFEGCSTMCRECLRLIQCICCGEALPKEQFEGSTRSQYRIYTYCYQPFQCIILVYHVLVVVYTNVVSYFLARVLYSLFVTHTE